MEAGIPLGGRRRMRCGRLSFPLVLLALLLMMDAFFSSAMGENTVHVGRATCGTTITIDSHWVTGPMWSFTGPASGSFARRTSTVDSALIFGRAYMSEEMEFILNSEAGVGQNTVVVFELNTILEPESECEFYWSPLKGAMYGTEITAARVMALGAGAESSCPVPFEVEVSLLYDEEVSHFLRVDPFKGTTNAVSFSTKDMKWPVIFRVPEKCEVYLLLLTNRQGSIHRWYVWIPATVFTAFALLLFTMVMLFPRDLPCVTTAIVMTFFFVGYLGSCIGLVMEILSWQSGLGVMFPFPDAVTLYCCLPIFYLLFSVLVLLRHLYRGILIHALLRLAVYGLNCALCCGYWVAGDVLLGSLTLLQFLLSNMFLSATYSYFAVILERSNFPVEPFPNAIGFLWFAPLTPFAPCLLMYYNLYMMKECGRTNVSVASVVKGTVMMYDTLTSFPLLFLQNIWGIALLATAAAYHMPFLVLLFAALLLFTVHFILSVKQYVKLRRRWIQLGDIRGGKGQFSFLCDWCTLWSSLEHCVCGALRQTPTGPEDRRGCYPMAAVSGDRQDGSSCRVSAWQAQGTNGDEALYSSLSTDMGIEGREQKGVYWPASVSM
ncbi:hypothetical protein MOQ_001248 [Trypanosoma cruzi marinkellei]|uniref:Uncharacterized protein n=1 Tax=Trypanosoma cruzi marinkellei TaxID=85056 RepID=K2NLA4_TRYCR|nr:hypothetical protein MOQ_001248 [Trypanosoma cruzi marinkellei]